MDAFTLKMIAIISMGIQHTTWIFWEIIPIWLHIPLYVMRGITFPIMAYFLTEGYRHTSNVKKYMMRLLIFALIAQIPYVFATGIYTLNIIFTILIGLICLEQYENLYVREKRVGLFVAVFLALSIISFISEGGMFCIILILLFHLIKDEKNRRVIPLICWGFFMLIPNLIYRVLNFLDMTTSVGIMDMLYDVQIIGVQVELLMLQFYVFSIGSFLIIPFLNAYNGEIGRNAKYLFYAFYPLHWIVLSLIAYFI